MADAWYVVQLQSFFGAASVAERRLSQQGFEAWAPRHPSTGALIFSGYCFIKIDPDDGPRWSAVRSTRGCAGVLPLGRAPRPMPTAFVEELRAAIAGYEEPTEVLRRWAPDDIVPILAGPFFGLEATFQQYKRGCLVLLVSLLGTQRRIQIPQHHCGRPPAAPRPGRAADPRLEAVAAAS